MKNYSIIKIDQAVHGYSDGHCLLAKSTDLSRNSQRQMLVMSDMSGHSTTNGFEEYLTGYPLIDDNYYAFGKTWYASEMKRPGCVWTHTLLVKFDDIQYVNGSEMLLNLFRRPREDFSKEDFSNQIKLPLNANALGGISCNNTTANKLRYLIYSIYSDSEPIILPSESADKYQELILLIWQNQWSRLRREFSFCTGSLANRKQNKKSLDIQVVPYALSRSISRTEKGSIVLDGDHMAASLSKYPKWVFIAADEILHEPSSKFKEFLEDFGGTFKEREYFKRLAKLYVEINAKKRSITIDGFLTTVKDIFDGADSDLITKSILEKQFQSFPCKWFSYKDVSEFLEDLSAIPDLNKTFLNQELLTSQLESLWESSQDKSKELFKRLISKELNQFGELILKRYSKLIKSEQLPLLTDMDLGACNVLVQLNPEFALCSEIWKQSRDFQCEIIDCVGKSSLNSVLSKKIIRTILKNSTEALYEQIFDVFGASSITTFLDWYSKETPPYESKIEIWMKICRCNPKACINWISSIKTIDAYLLASIAFVLDPYSPEVLHDISSWLKIFKQLNRKNINDDEQLAMAHFFLPLILKSDGFVNEDFVEFSFAPIHDRLAKNQIDYEQWSKLESLLPPVSLFNSWDKCKRLRKAIKKKGYSIKVGGYNW